MTGKPYQCSDQVTESSKTFVELTHHTIPRNMGPGFLMCGCHGAGENPNVHMNADHTTNDITIMSSATLLFKTRYNKSANCLANDRSNPTGPLDQSSAPSDERLSEPERESVTAVAQQCTEEWIDGFPYKSGYHLVMASSKMLIVPPQKVDHTPYVGSPGYGF
jgi:hypothetical protein